MSRSSRHTTIIPRTRTPRQRGQDESLSSPSLVQINGLVAAMEARVEERLTRSIVATIVPEIRTMMSQLISSSASPQYHLLEPAVGSSLPTGIEDNLRRLSELARISPESAGSRVRETTSGDIHHDTGRHPSVSNQSSTQTLSLRGNAALLQARPRKLRRIEESVASSSTDASQSIIQSHRGSTPAGRNDSAYEDDSGSTPEGSETEQSQLADIRRVPGPRKKGGRSRPSHSAVDYKNIEYTAIYPSSCQGFDRLTGKSFKI